MTLVKSLHSGDPDVMAQHTHEERVVLFGLQYILAKSMCHAVSHKRILAMLSHCCFKDEHMHWGIHVETPNRQQTSCHDSSLLECSGEGLRFKHWPGHVCLGALVEDGDNLVKSLNRIF
jgi:hypothetical protein